MTVGARMYERFQARRNVRLVSAVTFALLSVVYLTWRITIFNADAPVVSTLFYGAELIGVTLAFGAMFSSARHRYRTAPPAPAGLNVDVLVPVYLEPLDVIRRTLKAAVAIDYPHRTVVLDDGRRAEVKEMAEAQGAQYLSRPENHHAKAGNLNFGLEHSTAEFITVFDADHMPQAHALDVMLGFFDDPEVALVQTPQNFYNVDNFQFVNASNGALWHDQAFFYHIAMANSDSANSTICVGTGVVYRRSAIDAIGGIPTDTVTEDLHTSLKLHKRSFQTVYLNETIAYGIGENSLGDFYKVRLRWGHGNIHALRHENVLFCKGLSLWQRLSYLMTGLNYLEGWQYLIFYLVPIFSLFTGISAFEITLFNVLCMIVYPVVTYMLLQELACGFGRYWVNELYGMIRLPVAIVATFAILRNTMTWRTGSKDQEGKIEWAMMSPQLGIIVLSLAALTYGVTANWEYLQPGPFLKLLLDPASIVSANFDVELKPGYNLDLLLIAGFWALINVVRGILFVRKCLRHARTTHANYRFKIPLLLEISGSTGPEFLETREISLTHLSLSPPRNQTLPDESFTARLFIPGESLEVQLAPDDSGNSDSRSMEFADHCGRERLESCLYSVQWHRALFHDEAEFLTPFGFFANLARGRWCAGTRPHWSPVLISADSADRSLAYIRSNSEDGVWDFAAFSRPDDGQEFKIERVRTASLPETVRRVALKPHSETVSAANLVPQPLVLHYLIDLGNSTT